MTVVNPKSISGITSITTASGSDNLLTIHTSDANNTERLRIDSTGTTKIVTGIVTTLTATGSAKVGSGITLSPDGDVFAIGVSTFIGNIHLDTDVGGENNRLLVGSNSIRNVGGSANSGYLQIEGTSANSSSMSLINNQNATNSPVLRFGKTRGTSTGAVTTVAADDVLGRISFAGADGTDLENSTATIEAKVNGTVAGNQIPTDLVFETSATNGNSKAERLRIMSDGKVGIGSTIPTTTLDVNGVISGDGSGLTAVNTPSFAARISTTVTLSTTTEVTIVFNVEDHDTDGAYNTSTGEFTVPSGKGGVYFIAAQFGIDDPGEVGDIVRLRVFKNGSLLSGFRGQVQQASANIIVSTSVSGSETLAAGDVIKCMAYTDSNVGDALIEVDCTYFSMFRLSI